MISITTRAWSATSRSGRASQFASESVTRPKPIFGPCVFWVGVGEPSTFDADRHQSVCDIWNRESMPDVTFLE
jgi:hypothetical protein